MMRLLPLCVAFILAVAPLHAQPADGPASLIADSVRLEGRDRLIAEGQVEALYGEARLTASRIIYDRSTGALSVEGPITLTEGPNTVILASAAELDGELRNGLLTGARLVMDQQLQLAAYQLSRVDGRYTELYKATVSSCQVCENGGPPLWQIRARRVLHDTEAQQLHFDDARLEVLGVPVFYLPYLRLPDPTQERATGFLIPEIRRTSLLGTGLKLPHFLRLGDHRDLTLTPYLSSETRTLEFRYRQAYRTGRIVVAGAASQDDLQTGTRGYIEAAGLFALPRDFTLRLDLEAVGDKSYLSDYGYSDKDRLDSAIEVERARRDEFIAGRVTGYRTLRPDENNDTIPSIITDAIWERRLFPTRLGGELRLGAEAHHHYRKSEDALDGSDADRIVDGRDVTRLTASADWRRHFTLPAGIRAETYAGVDFDTFWTGEDAALPERQSGYAPTAALTLRWPLSRVERSGATSVLEPLAQVAWTGGTTLDVANDESTRVEFDQGNLLSLSRFPAPDRRERGLRGAVGLSWSRFTPGGWQTSLVTGSVLRNEANSTFTQSSGLTGTTSDLLLAAQIGAPIGIALTARGLFDNSLDASKAEARASWNNSRADIAATYVWLGPDAAEARPEVVSEWTLEGGYRVTPNWRAIGNIRYDVASDQTARAGFGVTYSNECVEATLSLSRRYTSSTIVTPSTDVSFTVGLRGFSAEAGGQSFVRSCRN